MLKTESHRVSWFYSQDEVPFFTQKKDPIKMSNKIGVTRTTSRKRDVTECIIYDAKDEIVAAARIVRGWGDKQNHDLARKISMRLALENSNLTKEQRKAVWEAYRVSTKVPRWNVTKK